MNYIDEIFLRGDIQQIREFLLHGAGEPNIDPRPYAERTGSAFKRVIAQLRGACTDEEEYKKAVNLVYDYVSVVEEVYMEIGLQLGAILAAQVCQNLKTALGKEPI